MPSARYDHGMTAKIAVSLPDHLVEEARSHCGIGCLKMVAVEGHCNIGIKQQVGALLIWHPLLIEKDVGAQEPMLCRTPAGKGWGLHLFDHPRVATSQKDEPGHRVSCNNLR